MTSYTLGTPAMNSSTWTTRGLAAFTAPPYDLVPFPIQYPVYYVPRASLFSWISDKDFSLLVPIAIYWGMGMLFHLIDISGLPYFEKYRIHEPEEVKQRNRVTVRTVIIGVVFQQILQTGLGLYWLDEQESIGEVFRDHRGELQVLATYVSKVAFALFGPSLGSKALRFGGAEATSWLYWWGIPIIQFLWAGFLIDTWQYFWHRYFHTNLFLYRHIHSVHHRLYCPYAFGALYNHPLEGFLFDTLGAVVAHSCSFMSTRQAILLFGISSVKTIDDHCGFSLPWDPMQIMFGNNVAYHDIHHQHFGIKKNFSQPYFTHWDSLLATRMTPAEVPEKQWDRYNAGPIKDMREKSRATALAKKQA